MTVKAPGTAEVTVTVEVPDPLGVKLTIVGLRIATLLVVVRATSPWKPLKLVSVRLVLPDAPAWTVMDCGLAVNVKSASGLTVSDIMNEWTAPPLTPVTVIL
jgi:hypothetical protein